MQCVSYFNVTEAALQLSLHFLDRVGGEGTYECSILSFHCTLQNTPDYLQLTHPGMIQ